MKTRAEVVTCICGTDPATLCISSPGISSISVISERPLDDRDWKGVKPCYDGFWTREQLKVLTLDIEHSSSRRSLLDAIASSPHVGFYNAIRLSAA